MADLLFRPGAAYELYKRPQKIYDFKSKVLSGMKARYNRVSAPCSHSSSNNPGDHEDLLQVDELSICLYIECQEVIRHDIY